VGGILYPYAQNKLRQYSSIFPIAEIDSTFYSLPRAGMVLGWTRNTPRDFLFSAKLPRSRLGDWKFESKLAIEFSA
jgi:uncharacterized protein YecE (DUF72 family)